MAITDADKVRVAEHTEITRALTYAADYLAYMRQRGSSLTLTWGEDTDQWECSWITGGERFVGVSSEVLTAVLKCYWAMQRAYAAKGAT